MKSLNEKIKEVKELSVDLEYYDNYAENVIDMLEEYFGINKFKIFDHENLVFSGDYVEFKEFGPIAYRFGRFNYGRVKSFRYVDGYAELYTSF